MSNNHARSVRMNQPHYARWPAAYLVASIATGGSAWGVSATEQPDEPQPTTISTPRTETSQQGDRHIELIEGQASHTHELDLVTAVEIPVRRDPGPDPTFDLKPDRYVVRVKVADVQPGSTPNPMTVDIADGFPNLFSEDFTLRSLPDFAFFTHLVDAEPISISPVLIFDRAAPSVSDLVPPNGE